MEDRNLRELQARIEMLELRLAQAEGRPSARLSRFLSGIGSSRRSRFALGAAVLAIATASYAATISMPHTFVNGTLADANEVNANFDALVAESNDQDARIATLEGQVVANTSGIAANTSNIATNASDIGANASNIAANASGIATNASNITANSSGVAANASGIAGFNTTFAGLNRAGSLLTFSGMNVQIVNGSGTTDGTINGLGNLIVGYNENSISATRTGSHNIVVGVDHEYTSYGGLVAGHANTISGEYSSVSAGYENTASGPHSSVSGGDSNTASGMGSSVSGGLYNKASYFDASVSGGEFNVASNYRSSVSGGQRNTASGVVSSVSGGWYNTAGGTYTSICGGSSANRTGQYQSAIGPIPSLSITGP